MNEENDNEINYNTTNDVNVSSVNNSTNTSNINSSYNTSTKKVKKSNGGAGSRVFVPFISGVLGASLVLGVCFGVPNIRVKLLSNSSNSDISTNSSGLLESNNNTQVADFINLTEYSETAVGVANKVLPSVVGISITYNVNTIFGSSKAEASGSGIIISEDGYILTNNHVVSNQSSNGYYQLQEANSLKVHLYDDPTEYDATIIGTDSYSDLAVLKIEKDGLTPATRGNSNDIKVGEFAMAIGNPLGMDSSVTCGIISAVNREVTSEDGNTYVAIQTDAAINSGNSGGALVNAKGEVIGINTLKLSGNGVEGIGFAIPISTTTEIVNQLIEFQSVKRPFIGIIGTTVDQSSIEKYGFPKGVYVRTIEEGSPTANSDLKVGDIITKLNGEDVNSIEQLNRIKNTHAIGDTITLTVSRNGEELEINVTLAEALENDEKEKENENEQQQNNNNNNNDNNNDNNRNNRDDFEDFFDDGSSFWDFFNY